MDIEDDVRILKQWYSKQYHLPQNIEEEYYYHFVAGTTSLEKAKRKIDAYFSMRKDLMNLLIDVHPNSQAYKNTQKALYLGILPEKTPDGCRVVFTATRPGPTPPFDLTAMSLNNLLMGEIASQMWPCDINFIIILDFGGAPLASFKTIEIRNIMAFTKFLSKALPFKLKGVYTLNVPAIGCRLYSSVIQNVMPKKISDRVCLYEDGSKLKDILPTSMLPAEYGGGGKSLKEVSDYWAELIHSRQKWFEERSKYCTDESKRPKDSFQRETMDFGVEGSFKMLNID